MDRVVCAIGRRSDAPLAAIVIFALLHAATTPASAWRPGLLPFTATGTITPFILLVILIERVELWNPTPVFLVAFALSRNSARRRDR